MNSFLGRSIYFGVQRLRGVPVLQALEELRRADRGSRDELLQTQACRQLAQLKFAVAHVPYYKAAFEPFRGQIEKARTWEDVNTLVNTLPVLKKGSLVGNQAQYTADNLNELRTYLDTTSGSSGTPLVFPCDKSAWAYRYALIFRCMEWFGVGVGERYALFFGLQWNRQNRARMFVRDALLNRVRISAFEVGPGNVDKHFKAIQAFRPTHIVGYPSAVSDFCTLLHEKGADLHALRLKAVFLTAETLHDWQKAIVEEVTGSRCVNMYGSAEGGGNAFECPHGSLHLAAEATWVGVRNEANGRGEALVTDMMLRAFPMIRYAVGDEISLKPGVCSCGRPHLLLGSIAGRTGEPILLPNGKRISPLVPYYMFRPLTLHGVIRRYRFVHAEGLPLHLFLVVTPAFGSDHLAEIKRAAKVAFGGDIAVSVHIVSELPQLPAAKHRDYVRLNTTQQLEEYLRFKKD